jgi:hypothetical protein
MTPERIEEVTIPTPRRSIHLQKGIKTNARTPAIANGINTGSPKYRMVVVSTIARRFNTHFIRSVLVMQGEKQFPYPGLSHSSRACNTSAFIEGDV